MEINGLNGYASYVQTPGNSPALENSSSRNANDATVRQDETLQRGGNENATQLTISDEGRQAAAGLNAASQPGQTQEISNTETTVQAGTTLQTGTTPQAEAQPTEPPTNEPAQLVSEQQRIETTLARSSAYQTYGMANNAAVSAQNAIDMRL